MVRKMFGILLAIIIVLCAAGYVLFRFVVPGLIPDGPGMVHEYGGPALEGEWIELDSDDPARLIIRGSGLRWKNVWGDSGSCGFTAEESRFGNGIITCTLTPDGSLPFETLEAQTDGERTVISGTEMEYDGRGLIVFSEFVRAEELALFPEDYSSPLACYLNEREPEPACITLGLPGSAELSDCLSWLGLPAEETDIDSAAIRESSSGPMAEVSGLLFGTDAYGDIRFGAEGAGYPVTEVNLTACDLTFDELRASLIGQYGQPQDEGEEPYAETSGGAVLWCEFADGNVRVKISAPSERNYVSLEARTVE